MTERIHVINTETAQLLSGDCGELLSVLEPCPDDPGRVLRCACGAEILPRPAAADE